LLKLIVDKLSGKVHGSILLWPCKTVFVKVCGVLKLGDDTGWGAMYVSPVLLRSSGNI
jgi:hypothetical protein